MGYDIFRENRFCHTDYVSSQHYNNNFYSINCSAPDEHFKRCLDNNHKLGKTKILGRIITNNLFFIFRISAAYKADHFCNLHVSPGSYNSQNNSK